jgi:hypothetical protein
MSIKTKARILNRIVKCNCGCQGRDPWHARYFTRVITIESEEHCNECDSHEGGYTWLTVARGTAQFPWGREAVHLQAVKDKKTGKITTFGWKRTGAY